MKNTVQFLLFFAVLSYGWPAAADRLDDAEAARQNGQYQRAIELFDEAIAKDRLSKDDLIGCGSGMENPSH